MSRYRKIQVRTWADEKFMELSPIPPCGQGLWFFLLTGPHTGPIPGLFRAGRAGMAEELGWELEAFDKAFAEAFQKGMVRADFKARLVWLPNALIHNKPESPNVVKGWRAELDLLPECDLKREAVTSIAAYLAGIGEAYVNAFCGGSLIGETGDFEAQDEHAIKPSAKALAKPFVKPSEKPSAKALPNQEQEQEQEQDKQIKHALQFPRDGRVRTPKPQARAVDNSTSGEVVRQLAAAGIPGVGASHPELLALIDRGASVAMFADAAAKSVAKGKGFRYLLGVIDGQLADAACLAQGAVVGHRPWDADRTTVEAEGERVGLGRWCGNPVTELFSVYTERVRQARELQEEVV